MLLRPDHDDLRVIGRYTARVQVGVGLAMLVPAALGAAWGEINEAAGFVIGASPPLLLGCAAERLLATRRAAAWHHGMVIAALSWLLAAFFGAVPLYLSGHYGAFLDAYFDAMSGFATAGLAVVNDLDHLADSVNLWRHVMQFLGGQGLVLMMLSLFATGGGAIGMYVGEAREERILPNLQHTARFIWRVSLTYFVAGTLALTAALLVAGLPAQRAVFHAAALFMAAFDTGGFAPNSASVGLYHSAAVEAVIAVLMVAGALSFALHFQLWHRRRQELSRNLESRVLLVTVLGLFGLTAVGLAQAGAYESPEALLRRGFFHVLSAHTGTGFSTVPGGFLVTDWGALAPAALVAAMAIGGMAGSTAGGIKAIRIGLIAKSIRAQIRRVVLPVDATTVETYHSTTPRVLRDDVTRSTLMILLLYLLLYLAGALAGMFYGYPLEEALFESTSASAAVGLSVGVVSPQLPAGLKVVYILQMWIGRLEFVAVLALGGWVWSMLRGRP